MKAFCCWHELFFDGAMPYRFWLPGLIDKQWHMDADMEINAGLLLDVSRNASVCFCMEAIQEHGKLPLNIFAKRSVPSKLSTDGMNHIRQLRADRNNIPRMAITCRPKMIS